MVRVAGKKVEQKDAAYDLAHHAVNLDYDALPPAVVKLTKQCILDTLGVMVGASTLAPEAKIVTRLVKELGGRKESTILGFGGKSPAPWATFANGSLGHMLDYDDVGGGGHPSVTTVPVAFAVGEKLGGVSGRDLLTSIAIGIDIQTRIDLAIPNVEWTMTEGWFATQLLGYFSGTAVAGRLLGLDEEQMINAFGIAFTQVSGSREMAVGAATHIRGMQGGFSGQGSILAALLAQRGIIGSKNSLEGRYNLYQVYLHTKPDREVIVGELGKRFPTVQSHGFKPWPSCAATHSIIDAILGLRKAHAIRPENVEEVVIIGGDMHTQLLSEPPESKRKPKISMDAKYSIPFTAAVAVTKGNVTLGDYTDAGLKDREVLAMAQRVRYQVIPKNKKTSLIPTVEIRTRDGKVYSAQVEHPLGRAQNPLSQQQLEAKFRDCVSFSAKPVSKANAERVIELVGRIEKIPDAIEVIRLLA